MKKKLALAAPFVVTLSMSAMACDPADDKPIVVPHTENPPAVNEPPKATTAPTAPTASAPADSTTTAVIGAPPTDMIHPNPPVPADCTGGEMVASAMQGKCHCRWSGNPPRSSHDFDCAAVPSKAVIPSKP